MSKTTQCEFVMIVDAQGDHAVGKDFDAAREAYETDIGSLEVSNGFRVLSLNLTVPVPEEVTVAATIPADGGEVALTVV